MRIAICTDCWLPQIDGIVRTLEATIRELRAMAHEVMVVSPADFRRITLPYGDALALPWYPRLAGMLGDFKPDTVHMATQGALGLCTRLWCLSTGTHYTTAFHTRFPEYAHVRFRLPPRLLYGYARLFHGRTAPVLVPTQTLADDLRGRAIGVPRLWSRGVDTRLFSPGGKRWTHYPRPIQLYVGRVVAEKNVTAFLRLATDGTKLVVGDGPQLAEARAISPDTVFLGALEGEQLAECYREADVLVFPSLLDTFGLVVLEALACGVPVAALPTAHLMEVFGGTGTVAFNSDLGAAIREALTYDAGRCRALASRFSWRACTEQFVGIVDEDRRARGYA